MHPGRFSNRKEFSGIEKESFGIVFALKKLLKFLHRRRFTLQTDQSIARNFGVQKRPADAYN